MFELIEECWKQDQRERLQIEKIVERIENWDADRYLYASDHCRMFHSGQNVEMTQVCVDKRTLEQCGSELLSVHLIHTFFSSIYIIQYYMVYSWLNPWIQRPDCKLI